MSVCVFNSVRKRVEGFTLSVEDYAVERARIYAVTGANGAGKTTLLNLAGLIDRPSEGQLLFGGSRVDYDNSQRLRDMRRRIAYITQKPYLFDMSVNDNIAYGLRIRNEEESSIKHRVPAIMERLRISHLPDRKAHELSGGEAQLVAIARTLVMDADIYLLDEPTSGVDRENLKAVEEVILELGREKNAGVIITTHSVEQAERLADVTLALDDGLMKEHEQERGK